MSSQTKTVTTLSDRAAQMLFAPVRVPLLRLWWASSGRAAVARVTPLYVGLMVLGGVLFGGNGMAGVMAESWPVDTGYFGMAGQKMGYFFGVFASALHAQVERFDAA
jgi:hypothetical protein